MVNLKINLLHWRQKRRDRLQREFLNGLAAVGLVAVLLLVGAWRVYESAIDTQKARVAVIASEIEGLDARIAEIRVLQKKRKELLDRMRVIQELQGNRPVSVADTLTRPRARARDRWRGCAAARLQPSMRRRRPRAPRRLEGTSSSCLNRSSRRAGGE